MDRTVVKWDWPLELPAVGPWDKAAAEQHRTHKNGQVTKLPNFFIIKGELKPGASVVLLDCPLGSEPS